MPLSSYKPMLYQGAEVSTTIEKNTKFIFLNEFWDFDVWQLTTAAAMQEMTTKDTIKIILLALSRKIQCQYMRFI